MSTRNKAPKTAKSLSVRDTVIFAMLGTVMFISKLVMEFLPNVHLLGMLTMAYTIAFGVKALMPIYVYVALNGLYSGFSMWWVPYTYIWTILFLITIILPKRMPKAVKLVVYPTVCALHGFAFGTLYAPAQAVMFGFDLEQTIAWIIAGIPFDIIHGVSNFIAGLLVLPTSELLSKLYHKKYS